MQIMSEPKLYDEQLLVRGQLWIRERDSYDLCEPDTEHRSISLTDSLCSCGDNPVLVPDGGAVQA